MLKIFSVFILAVLLAGGVLPAGAQLKIGGNSTSPAPNALLEMESTTQGLLPPRMLQAQMNAIASPVAGMLLYCTNCLPMGLHSYNGSTWVPVGTSNAPLPATFISGTLSCFGALNGTYYQGVATNNSNTKELFVTINTTGNYTATTDTVNGLSFAAAGTLNTTGTNKIITLAAAGTPLSAGTFSYKTSLGGQTCNFTVTYASQASFACENSTNSFTPAGGLASGTGYSGSYVLPYTAGSGASYTATTLTQNGLSLTRTAGTYAPGGGNVVYTLSGTYTGSTPSVVFNLPEGCRAGIPPGYVSTFAGLAGSFGSADGTGSTARFNDPAGLATDTAGNVYVADRDNHTIRKITPAGAVTTLAGSAGVSGSADGTGSSARFNTPQGVAADAAGNIYVADYDNHTIRKITPAGVVTTLAGSAGNSGSADGAGPVARFNRPISIAIGAGGSLYVADRSNNTIRKITPGGTVTTLAGSAGNPGSTDGTGSAAQFKSPSGVAIDGGGNLYVADRFNHSIRKVSAAGVVTTLAGNAGNSGSANGTGSAAEFSFPYNVAVDAAGMVYVTDAGNHTIRKITPAGAVTTFAGSAGSAGGTNGPGSTARFNNPAGITMNVEDIIYVSDLSSHTIRKITP